MKINHTNQGISRNRISDAVLRLSAAALLALAPLFSPISAGADSNPGNDSDQLVIRILPSIDLGVTVDTTGSAWVDGGNLDISGAAMNSSHVMFTGVRVQVTGSFNKQELTIEGVGLDTWSLDTDESAEDDKLRLYGMFGEYQLTAPASSDFNGANNLITNSAQNVGQTNPNEVGDTNHNFELDLADTGYQDMDDMKVGTQRTLWLRADMPTQTSSDQTQRFTITVTAVSGGPN